MRFVLFYLIFFLVFLSYLLIEFLSGKLPDWMNNFQIPFLCGLSGGFGGILYCLRGIYLNYSVKNIWDSKWIPWYVIRPIVSIITGGVSFLFLKAGLLVLEAKAENGSTNLGFYALAFVAGLNVDKFISKIEDLAQATWGIEKSRSNSKNNSEK